MKANHLGGGITAFLALLLTCVAWGPAPPAQAQVPAVIRTARALAGARKLEAALKLERTLSRAGRARLLADPEVKVLLGALDDPKVARYLRGRTRTNALLRTLKPTQALGKLTVACPGGRCALRDLDGVIKEIDGLALEHSTNIGAAVAKEARAAELATRDGGAGDPVSRLRPTAYDPYLRVVVPAHYVEVKTIPPAGAERDVPEEA